MNVIVELKQKGYSNEDAITIALNRVGSVIMTAGFIMIIAFGGLIFSSVASLVQIGFILFLGVLIDA